MRRPGVTAPGSALRCYAPAWELGAGDGRVDGGDVSAFRVAWGGGDGWPRLRLASACLVLSCLAWPGLVTPCLLPRGFAPGRYVHRSSMGTAGRVASGGKGRRIRCTLGRVMGGEYIIVSRDTVIAIPKPRIQYSVTPYSVAVTHFGIT